MIPACKFSLILSTFYNFDFLSNILWNFFDDVLKMVTIFHKSCITIVQVLLFEDSWYQIELSFQLFCVFSPVFLDYFIWILHTLAGKIRVVWFRSTFFKPEKRLVLRSCNLAPKGIMQDFSPIDCRWSWASSRYPSFLVFLLQRGLKGFTEYFLLGL